MNLVLDGEASPSEKSDFDGHLESCPECRQQFGFYSQLKSMTRTDLSQEVCPELLKARLMKVLRAEVKPVRKSRPVAFGLGWVAAASAALFSFYALRPATEKATPLALSLSEDHSRCEEKPNSVVAHNPAYLAEQTFGQAMPEMVQHQKLRPYDVRLCPVLQGQPVIHVLCKDDQERCVSVYTMPSEGFSSVSGSAQQPVIVNCDKARVASWQHKGWLFSLVSRVPQQDLASIASNCSYGNPRDSDRLYARPIMPPQGMPVQAIPAMHRP